MKKERKWKKHKNEVWNRESYKEIERERKKSNVWGINIKSELTFPLTMFISHSFSLYIYIYIYILDLNI